MKPQESIGINAIKKETNRNRGTVMNHIAERKLLFSEKGSSIKNE